jgi:hypothetical protein
MTLIHPCYQKSSLTILFDDDNVDFELKTPDKTYELKGIPLGDSQPEIGTILSNLSDSQSIATSPSLI